MVDVSKTTADRLGFSGSVVSAIEVQGGVVAERIATAFKLPKSVVVGPFVEWVGGVLRESGEALREKDLAHLGELADDDGFRAERDESVAALRDLLSRAAQLVAGAYGEGFAGKVGLASTIPARPDLLASHATNVARQLGKARAPAKVTAGARIDLDALGAGVEQGAERLSKVLSAVKREEREAQRTLEARERAAAEWERVYTGVAEIFAGLCRLADLEDLADKVKPTARRRAGIPEEAAPAEPGPES